MGFSVAMSGGASMLSSSSPQTIWASINQFQLLLLLPLTGAFMDPEVVKYFQKLSFVSFNFNFIPIKKLPFVTWLHDTIGYNQENEYFENIGISNGSTLINILSLTLVIWLLILCHLLILLTKKCANRDAEKWKRTLKLANKLHNLFTFSIYIRFL